PGGAGRGGGPARHGGEDVGPHGVQVGGQHLVALRPVVEVGQVLRQRGAHAGRPLDGVGELGRVGGRHAHERQVLPPATGPAGPGGADADRRVGGGQVARAAVEVGDHLERRVVVEAGSG